MTVFKKSPGHPAATAAHAHQTNTFDSAVPDVLRVVRGEMVPLHAEGARPQLAHEVNLDERGCGR